MASTPQTSSSIDASAHELSDKSVGDNRMPSSVQLSSASSIALPAGASNNVYITRSIQWTPDGGVIHEPPSSLTLRLASSATDAPRPSAREQPITSELEKLQTLHQQSAENQKRKRSEAISRKLGNGMDPDREREFWLAFSERSITEHLRQAALALEASRQEDIIVSARHLRKHINPGFTVFRDGSSRLTQYPIFRLQRTPLSNKGARCRLLGCLDRIQAGQYRIALTPGIWRTHGQGNLDSRHDATLSASSVFLLCSTTGFGQARFATSTDFFTDFYHVKCFEELLDLSSPHYAARFESEMLRYRLDLSAECILKEYISRWELRCKQPLEHERDSQSSPGTKHAGAENSTTQRTSATPHEITNTMERRGLPLIPDRKPAASEQAHTTSSEGPTKSQFVSGPAAPSALASHQNGETDTWKLADETHARVREEADFPEGHNSLLGKFFFQVLNPC